MGVIFLDNFSTYSLKFFSLFEKYESRDERAGPVKLKKEFL